MAEHNWTTDAAVGILKNHYIGNKLLVQAVGECKVAQFARPFPGVDKVTKGKGETINIMHVDELTDPASFQLDELTNVPIDKLSIGNRAVTLVEFGRGVEITNKFHMLSKFDPKNFIQQALIRQMTRALDTGAGTAFTHTDVKVCFIPTSITGGTWDTDGTPSTIATANITFDHMGVLADYLAGTIHTPPFEGDDYVMISSRKTLRGLKQDDLWQQVHMYLRKGDLFFKGEAGKAENIRTVQIDREAALSNTAGTSAVLGDAVVFGDEAIGYAEAQTPTLKIDTDHQKDFERFAAAAWVGIYVYGSVWNTATDGEAKIIRITSA